MGAALGIGGRHAIEGLGGVRMHGQILPVPHPEHPMERRFPRLHALEQSSPRFPAALLPLQHRPRAQGARDVLSQELGFGGQREGTVPGLRKDAVTGQRPQHPVQGRGIHRGGCCQLVKSFRALFELVGDP
jgi:hypothetical protein